MGLTVNNWYLNIVFYSNYARKTKHNLDLLNINTG